jgi:hypothetical protein
LLELFHRLADRAGNPGHDLDPGVRQDSARLRSALARQYRFCAVLDHELGA